jgi:hypothetical protein
VSRRAKRPQPLPLSRKGSYVESSRRPLETLLFLLPLVLFYEWGLMAWLRSGDGTLINKAHGGIVGFFRLFGVRAEDLGLPILSLPALGLVLTLLAWQVIGRFPWKLRAATLGCMFVESFALAAPLLPVGMLLSSMESTLMAPSTGSIQQMGLMQRAAMAAGAGVYEELAFRMVVMGGLHMLLSDVGGWRKPGAWVAAMVVSALLFAVYHPLRGADGGYQWWRFAFLVIGGAWFGTLYHWRGFGIAAGTHAAYDITALLLWRA